MDQTFITALLLGAVAVFALPLLWINDRQKRRIAERRKKRGEKHVVASVEARHHALWTTLIVTAVATSIVARRFQNPVVLAVAVPILAIGTYIVSRRVLVGRSRKEAARAATRTEGDVGEVGVGQLLTTVVVIAVIGGLVVLRIFFPRRPGGWTVAWVIGGSLVAVVGLFYVWIRYQLRHVRSVNRLLQERDFEGAELALRRKLESDPRSGPLNMLYGSVLMELQRYDEAAEVFERAKADKVQCRGARVSRGIALWESGREAGGEVLLVEVTSGGGTTAVKAASELARRLARQGRVEEARNWLSRAEERLAELDWLTGRAGRSPLEEARIVVDSAGRCTADSGP